jgi:uncharacterized membrane protein YgcG
VGKVNNYKLILLIMTVSFSSLFLFSSKVLAHSEESALKPISERFTGVWEGKVSQKISKKKSSVVGNITLTLCVEDGILSGTVNQEGVYNNAVITPTEVISKKEVVLTLNDIQLTTNTLLLRTSGSKKLKGSFGNNFFISAKKTNSDGCSALNNNESGGTSSSSGGSSTSSSSGGQQPTESIPIPDAINPTDETRIPIGDGNISTSAKIGNVFSCQTMFDSGVGASVVGPWVNTVTNTWDSTKKVAVSGNVNWPDAVFSVDVSGDKRVITGNDLPVNHTTGIFPISPSEPAYAYDRNPNSIKAQNINLSLPLNPTFAASPSCLPAGAIAILTDGIVLFNPLDEVGRDAPAYETIDDKCEGHPQQQGIYHHHNIPSCILAKALGANTSTLVGYAYDGFGIYVERDKNGKLLTNANLDECHGRTSKINWDGNLVEMYHYVATLEYPYVIGCYKGTPVQAQNSTSSGGQSGGGQQGGGAPPAGATTACSGKSSGSSCSFVDGSMTVSGTCSTPPGQNTLSCVP